MKILIVTHSFSPDLTPRAFRWAAIASQLTKQGHEVRVLCASQLRVPDGTEFPVHRVADPILKSRPAILPAPDSHDRRYESPRIFKSWARSAIRKLWRSLYWPDYACGWILPATRIARSLSRTHRFDWIITTSHPFSGHLVWLLARKASRSSRWLVDIGDPYAMMRQPSPYNRLIYGLLSRLVEKRLVELADRISVTTKATASLYEKGFAEANGKTVVIPPLLSLPAPPPRTKDEDEVTDLVFVGTLYRKLRSPRYLIDCFAALVQRFPDRRFRLHFYGAANDCSDVLAEYSGHPNITVLAHGLVDRAIVLHAMANADFLLNIGNHSASQLGSKVIEYMAMGRPIVNVVSMPDDISLDVLSTHPSCFTISAGDGAISEATLVNLAHFLQDPPRVSQDYARDVRHMYSAEEISRQYLVLMSENSSVALDGRNG